MSDSVTTNEAGTQELVERLFSAIDRKDTDGVLSCIDLQASFRFGSAPAVQGHEAIAGAIDGFYETIAALQHTVQNTLRQENLLVCEGTVRYTRHDTSTVTLPFTNVFDLAGQLITGYRIYIDIGPLYAPHS